MTDALEDAHRATMQNSRAAAMFAPLCRPGETLVVLVWDSWSVKIQKPSNHWILKTTFSTKHHGNSFSRLEAVDLEGRPVFTQLLSASISPRATDESMCFFNVDLETQAGLAGGLTDMLKGLPGYCIVHLFDNGFRYFF